MQKKINLEEILRSKSNICFDDYEDVILAMKEACRQTLELAAKNAKLVECDPCEFYINKQSILDTINLIE